MNSWPCYYSWVSIRTDCLIDVGANGLLACGPFKESTGSSTSTVMVKMANCVET
jgi:hypothetical protein